MKTLIFQGSPKKKGETQKLIDTFIQHIQGEVEIIYVMDQKQIYPCLDCRQCKKEVGCSQIDGFEEVIKKIDESDCIVIASPMWFGNISGPLMSYLSRLQTCYQGYESRKDRTHKWDKAGVFMMTTGAKWHSMAKSVEASVEFLFKEMDTMMLDCIYANKSDILPAQLNKQAMIKAKIAAKKVNDWYKDKEQGFYIQYGYSSCNYINYEDNKIREEDLNEK